MDEFGLPHYGDYMKATTTIEDLEEAKANVEEPKLLETARKYIICGHPVDEEFFEDLDQDGFTADEDCEDADPHVFPGATEVCDGIDNDCDGAADDEDDDTEGLSEFFPDIDGDGYGDGGCREVEASGVTFYLECRDSIMACEAPPHHVAAFRDAIDCDDNDASVKPGDGCP